MHVRLPCDTLAPVVVRRHLEALPALGWLLGDAMLVATELVTNAVRHSRCRRDDALVVTVSRGPTSLRVSVSDPGRSGGSARLAEEGDIAGGLGLRIVEQLAARWGSRRDENRYEVWAELPLGDSGCGSGQREPASCLPDTYSYSR